VRVFDGRVAVGRYIPERAYAFFLAGALAEAGGTKPDLENALAHYEGAAQFDGNDPETWTRAARLRCALDPADGDADVELDRALRLAPAYPPALAARAACARTRAGAPAGPLVDDPLIAAEVPSTERAGLAVDERRRLEALTLEHGDRVAAWETLEAWATAHGDASLAARAMVRLARLAPAERLRLGHAVVALAGAGHLFAAREVAAALLDAPGDRSSGGEAGPATSLPLVVALALDEALIRRDLPRVRARAERAHVEIAAAAGRAWAMGDAALARDLVALVVKADPEDPGARLVHEGAEGRAASHLIARGDGRPVGALAPEVALPFARQVLITEGPGAARRVVAAAGPLPTGDVLLTRVLVDLAVGGAAADESLPPDARIEVAARRGVPPLEVDLADATLDARHKLLALVLLHPTDATTDALAARLAPAAAEDPLVAVALARLHLIRGAPFVAEASTRARLESAAAADALVAAALVDLVAKDGPGPALTRAQHRLAGLAMTPAERARVSE
jgi:hypothetical protein